MALRFINTPLFKFSFFKFSLTLDILQKTPSTIQKISTLSNYLKTLNQAQKSQAKKLFDFVNQKINTGISDRLLINQFNKLNQSQPSISQILKNKQTIKYIEQFIPQDKKSSDLKIQDINTLLVKLTQINGKKAVQIKSQHVFTILNQLSFIQTRYLLRILTKDFKIGMKNKLILKAYQDAYQSQNNPNSINFKSFNPMLARPLRDVQQFQKFCAKKNGIIIADVKYDGERTLITYQKDKKVVLISRNGKQQNQKYYKIAEQLQSFFESLPWLKSITIDGQIVAVDKQTKQPLPFQVLLTRKRKQDSLLNIFDPNDTNDILQLIYAFDILQHNGEILYQIPLTQRRKILKKFQNSLIKMSQSQTFAYPEQKDKLMEYFHSVVKRKYQGLILKGPEDFYYVNGTRIHWGKLKKGFRQNKDDKGQFDLDLIVMGADYGKGKKSKFLSSFLLGIRDGDKIIPISKVGSGFTDDDLQELTQSFGDKIIQNADSKYDIPELIRMDVWFRPQCVFEVDCQQMTRSPLYRFGFKEGYGGISLRFPIFKRLRGDKDIGQATDGNMILQQMQKQQSHMMNRAKQKLDKIINEKKE